MKVSISKARSESLKEIIKTENEGINLYVKISTTIEERTQCIRHEDALYNIEIQGETCTKGN